MLMLFAENFRELSKMILVVRSLKTLINLCIINVSAQKFRTILVCSEPIFVLLESELQCFIQIHNLD